MTLQRGVKQGKRPFRNETAAAQNGGGERLLAEVFSYAFRVNVRAMTVASMALLVAVSVVAVACGGGGSTPPPAPATAGPAAAPSTASPYAIVSNWLCHPATYTSPCAENLDATILSADGSLAVEPYAGAVNPPIDCFYVYPTVSTDGGVNSDLEPGAAEKTAVLAQAARLGAVCRLWAPNYRQITLTALFSGRFGDAAARDIAYGDVLAAWNYYLAEENAGRGVVLIGHSQGSLNLLRLLREQIDPDPSVRRLLIAAYLPGTSVRVPAGGDVGGDLLQIPACRKPEQTGCVVSYASFSAASPPPFNSFFGRRADAQSEALCVNPAALAGGVGDLHPYIPAASSALAARVSTPFVGYAGMVTGECLTAGAFSYLRVTADPRVLMPAYSPTPEWGIHTLDVSIAMGDIVTLVGKQGAAFKAP